MTPPWQPPPSPSLCFFRSSCLHSAEKGQSVSSFRDIFFFFSQDSAGAQPKCFYFFIFGDGEVGILHLATRIIGWIGEFRHKKSVILRMVSLRSSPKACS